MGRTISAYSMQMERVLERFRDFRRGLRKEDQEILDTLFRAAKIQVQSGAMASNPNPLDSMILSMLIHLQKENLKLQKQVEALQEKVKE